MKAIDVTDENFEQLIAKSGKIAVVDFSAEWCPPCKAMTPVLELLASEMDGRVMVGKIDVDTNPETTAKFGVRNLPTFLFFRDGELVDRIVGAVSKAVITQKLAALQ